MNENIEQKCRDLIEILSCHEADPEEVEEALPAMKLALTNPGAYIEAFPEHAWLADTYDVDQFEPRLAEDLFTCALSGATGAFEVSGDKGDEIFEAVVDVLDEMGIVIEAPDFPRGNWFDYSDFVDSQLIKLNANKRLVSLDMNFCDDVSVFVVESTDYAKLLELFEFFNLKFVDSATFPKFNS